MLNRLTLLALVITLVPLAPAQEGDKQPPQEPLETRIVQLEHVRAEHLANLFRDVRAIPSDALDVISFTGTKQQLDEIEAQIKTLDVSRVRSPEPPSNVEIMVHYVGADVGTQPIPEDSRLQAVVEQLRSNFAYENYSLLASYMVRASVNASEVVGAEGMMPTLGYEPLDGQGEQALASSYELQFRLVQMQGAAPNRTIVLQKVFARWSFPGYQLGEPKYENAQIQTSVNLPEGKLVVLGKAGMSGSDRGIFLVLEARPVE